MVGSAGACGASRSSTGASRPARIPGGPGEAPRSRRGGGKVPALPDLPQRQVQALGEVTEILTRLPQRGVFLDQLPNQQVTAFQRLREIHLYDFFLPGAPGFHEQCVLRNNDG